MSFFAAAQTDKGMGSEGLVLSAGSLKVPLRNHPPLYLGAG